METIARFDWCELSHEERTEIDALIKQAAGTLLFPGGKLLAARELANGHLARVKQGLCTEAHAARVLRMETALLTNPKGTR